MVLFSAGQTRAETPPKRGSSALLLRILHQADGEAVAAVALDVEEEVVLSNQKMPGVGAGGVGGIVGAQAGDVAADGDGAGFGQENGPCELNLLPRANLGL